MGVAEPELSAPRNAVGSCATKIALPVFVLTKRPVAYERTVVNDGPNEHAEWPTRRTVTRTAFSDPGADGHPTSQQRSISLVASAAGTKNGHVSTQMQRRKREV